MTVSSTDRFAGPFIGTGLVSVFPFAFKVFVDEDVTCQVTLGGQLTTLALNSDFTVALNADQDDSPGGTVTLTTALASGAVLYITSLLAFTQPVDLKNTGGFFPKTVEDMVDRAIILLQQAVGGVGGAIRVPEVQGIAALPSAANRTNTWLAFDGNGAPTVVAPQTDATIATTTPIEVGGVPELVDLWIRRQRITPEQYGAAANGANYTTELQNAINAAAGRGVPLAGNGRKYRFDGTLYLPNTGLEIEDLWLDTSQAAAGSYALQTLGALGAPISITAPVARGAGTLPVSTTTGLSPGSEIIVQSADLWANGGGSADVKKGEWAVVDTVGPGLQVTLTQPLRDSYSTAPVIYVPAQCDHAIFTNFHMVGGGAGLNQFAMRLLYCRNVRIYNSDARKHAADGFVYASCQTIEVDGGRPGEGDDTTGRSYGHAFNGATISAKFRNITGDRLRHVVSGGGSQGVIRGYRCDSIVGVAMTDATVDAHPAVDDFKAYDIDHTADTRVGGSDGDGIVSQARYTQVDGFKIDGCGRHAILVQPFCVTDPSVVIIGSGEATNFAATNPTSGLGIALALTQPNQQDCARLSVGDVRLVSAGATAGGVAVTTVTASLLTAKVDGATIQTPGRALNLDAHAVTGKKIVDFHVRGGRYERTNTSAECVIAQGNAAGDVDFLRFSQMHAVGGSIGLRGINCTNYRVSDNDIKGSATRISGFTHDGTTQFVERNNIT